MVRCDRQVADLQCDVQSLELKRDSLLQELRSAQEELRQLHTDNGTMLREQRTAKVTQQGYTIRYCAYSIDRLLRCRYSIGRTVTSYTMSICCYLLLYHCNVQQTELLVLTLILCFH
jgi:FtsZ-binding cell division protein ZapB